MTSTILHIGSTIASDLRDSSVYSDRSKQCPKTVGDLLRLLEDNPPREFSMLRSTCSMLADYFGKPADEILFDSVQEARTRLRPYLESRKYAENSIRTYVNHVRILLNRAKECGWNTTMEHSAAWRPVLELAAEAKCKDVSNYLAKLKKTPRQVTVEDVERWAELRLQEGASYSRIKGQQTRFWRLLRHCGCMEDVPLTLLREKDYGVPLGTFVPQLQVEANELLRWKLQEYSIDRPSAARHRPVSSKKLQKELNSLYGFAVNIRGDSDIRSLSDLITKDIVSHYVQWCINERKVKATYLLCKLGLVRAAFRHHPKYQSLDLAWFKPLLDGIPKEHEWESKERKAQKYLKYEVLEGISSKIRACRSKAAKKGTKNVALAVRNELLIKWLTILPWRQRNIRECRIGGPRPNLFQAALPPFSPISKPKWVEQAIQQNPDAEFWQFKFTPNETKMKNQVHVLLPRQLIELLEEYINHFRIFLVGEADPGTLFVNEAGKAMTLNQVTNIMSNLTLRYGGRRVTPHLFRDIVAYTWLDKHPKDYLNLSKMLWHSDVNTTIRIYGSRFDESDGVCRMEEWLDERS